MASPRNAKTATKKKPTIASLDKKAESLPKMIRPKYLEFDCPSGQEVIIKKIPIGMKDVIVDRASDEKGEMDMGQFCAHAVHESLVYPELKFEQIGQIEEADFYVIWANVNEFSYGKVGEVVKRFRNGK